MKKDLENYTKVSLFFFFVVSCFGVLLRYIPLYEGEIVWNYERLLQTHSHIAFLGWIFNIIYIITLKQYPNVLENCKFLNYKLFFLLFQFATIMIASSLLIWGYKVLAITFLSLHAYSTVHFAVRFIKNADKSLPGTYLLKIGYILMSISYLGTIMLGPISAMGYKYSDLYYSSIYFYLHFQYNGFFLLAILGFLINYWDKIILKIILPKNYINLFLISIILTYALSILFSKPKIIINIIAFIGSALQLFLIIKLFVLNKHISPKFDFKLGRYVAIMVIILFITRLISQVVAPIIPNAVYSNRPLIILFLHLNFLGVITPLLLYLINIYIIKSASFMKYIIIFVIVFLNSELFLFINSLSILEIKNMYMANFISVLLLSISILFLNIAFWKAIVFKENKELNA